VSAAGEGPTIFALSSAAGRAAIAVLRVSGPRADAAIRALSGREPPKPRFAALRRIASAGERIDDALVLWFPAPATETGEDMAEFHLHGGRAVVAAALQALAKVPGLRPAGPGEFTRQAFDNGKLDLTQAEAIADLVEAETAAQRRQALRQLDGAFGRQCEAWRGELLAALARAEAMVDFPDEDLPAGIIERVHLQVLRLQKEITLLLDNHRGESLREGISIAILGAPNAGKSSLLNFLARREAAIVSARAGTTRDVIEVHLDLAGYPVILADTAGLRDSGDEIEAEGVRRARARAAAADLKLVLFDGAAWPAIDGESAALLDERAIPLVSKADIARDLPGEPMVAGRAARAISVMTGGAGTEALLKEIEARVVRDVAPGEAPALTRTRHRLALEDCAAALARAGAAALPELLTEDLRLAARALGRITGRVDVEEVLDAIFREFCIGK
jgi:tRNA modification GTPase